MVEQRARKPIFAAALGAWVSVKQDFAQAEGMLNRVLIVWCF